MTSSISPEMMLAAQGLTGTTIAAWLLVGFLPGDRRQIRTFLLAFYFVAALALVAYTVLR